MIEQDNNLNRLQSDNPIEEHKLSNIHEFGAVRHTILINKHNILSNLSIIAQACKSSKIGKLLPDALYIHVSALRALEEILQNYELYARGTVSQVENITLVKFCFFQPKISYLFYPEFDTDPHPALHSSFQIDLESFKVVHRDYSNSKNPPILHRKETFVTPEYPNYGLFAELTGAEVAMGLLKDTKTIGTRSGWEKRLRAYNVKIVEHRLVPLHPVVGIDEPARQIDRYKAAIIRGELSRPVRLALEAGLFTQGNTFFDYGCGHGEDIKGIAQQGYISTGWDPYYLPKTEQAPADIVNLGYVINVIENTGERRDALLKAWELTRRVLLVAAQVTVADTNRGTIAYGDGVVTTRNTFQKYYEQEELKIYIDQVLGVEAIPAGLGIYFVFRNESEAQLFRASRFRSRATTPRVKVKVKQFEDYQELLAPLMAFITERGRLPSKGELESEDDITAEFGSIKRAYHLILQATDPTEWEAISQKRRQDLMVYLALSKFSRTPKLVELAPTVQEDIKSLFGTYKQACSEAGEMLHSLGDLENIKTYCQNSTVGKKLPLSLLVHVSALQNLDPLLRLYEGCASRTIGRMEGANVIKIHTRSPKISYLYYPDFDTDPHPALHTKMSIDLRNLNVTYEDFDNDDPPILHYKDALLNSDYPLYEKFARLTAQEEDWGLLDDWRLISTRSGWLKCLKDHCAILKGYQLLRQKDADPYKLKVLRAGVERRKYKNKKQSTTNSESTLDVSSKDDAV